MVELKETLLAFVCIIEIMECMNKFVGVHFADMKLQVYLRASVNLFIHFIISIMIFKGANCKSTQEHKYVLLNYENHLN